MGFHNIAIHEYKRLDVAIDRATVVERLDDCLACVRTLLCALWQAAPRQQARSARC